MKHLALSLLLVSLTGCDMIKSMIKEKAQEVAATPTTPAAPATPTAVGTPLAPVPVAQPLGTEMISAQACRFEGAEFLGDSGTTLFKALTVVGDSLVLSDSKGALHGFKVAPGPECRLTVDPTFGTAGVLTLEQEVNWLSHDTTNRLVASNGIFAAWTVQGGQVAGKCETGGHIEMHPSGTWGIAPWVNATVKKVDFAGAACTPSDWALRDLSDDAKRQGPVSTVGAAAIVGDDVLIGGMLAKAVDPDQNWTVLTFDAAGVEKSRLAISPDISSPQHFGWIHAISGCKQGICVVDSNFRRLSAWTTTGAFVGAVDLGLLFNLDYAWISDFDIDGQGQAFFATAQKRADSDTVEGLIFRVQGLAEGTPVVAEPVDRKALPAARPTEAAHPVAPAAAVPVRQGVHTRPDAFSATKQKALEDGNKKGDGKKGDGKKGDGKKGDGKKDGKDKK